MEYSLYISQLFAVSMLGIVVVCSGKIFVKSNDGSINDIFKIAGILY